MFLPGGWGATLTIGQVSSYGRLEVTALGDQMNEAARIEAVATDGRILASKDLLERLASDDAKALQLDVARMHFTALRSLGSDVKALRDAGLIAVAEICRSKQHMQLRPRAPRRATPLDLRSRS